MTRDYAYIYIPIWLDLLYDNNNIGEHIIKDLHSNMVRFIMHNTSKSKNPVIRFTFQYG